MRPARAVADAVGDGSRAARGEAGVGGELEGIGGAGEGEVRPARHQVEGVAAEPVAERADDPVGAASGSMSAVMPEAAPQQRDGLVGHRTAARGGTSATPGGPGRRDEAGEAVDEPVGDGQDVVRGRLGPPELDEPLQAVRLSVGAVGRLGEVGRQVEQLPAVLVEGAAPDGQLLLVEDAGADVVGRRLPAVVVDRPRPEHLEVLRGVSSARRGSSSAVRRLTPSMGCWATPSTSPGTSRPTASRMVGMRSMAWANWERTTPAARHGRASGR